MTRIVWWMSLALAAAAGVFIIAGAVILLCQLWHHFIRGPDNDA